VKAIPATIIPRCTENYVGSNEMSRCKLAQGHYGQHEAGNDVVKVNWGDFKRPPSIWDHGNQGVTSPIAEAVLAERRLMDEVLTELRKATNTHGHFHSGHEGYGVIAEELDELWDDVKAAKASTSYPEQTRREAIQVAAMAMRFALDLCVEKK
jgi:hypothetical protein